MSPTSDRAVPPRRLLRARVLAVALVISTTAMTGAVLAPAAGAHRRSVTLHMGSSGRLVKRVQRRLHVRATGYYGSLTRRAVRRFQRRHGLTVDGVAGPATLRALGIGAHSARYSSGGASAPRAHHRRLPAELQRIAQCESGGNPRAVSPDGRYRGKYQFDRATWRNWGGTGDPAAAPEAVQDHIALRLYRARGAAPWPNCA